MVVVVVLVVLVVLVVVVLGPMFFSFHFTNPIITNVPFSLRSLRLTQGWSDTPS